MGKPVQSRRNAVLVAKSVPDRLQVQPRPLTVAEKRRKDTMTGLGKLKAPKVWSSKLVELKKWNGMSFMKNQRMYRYFEEFSQCQQSLRGDCCASSPGLRFAWAALGHHAAL